MTAHNIHDRIIAEAGRELLGPLGFVQKGRSRLWWADHGWWATVVEFQPSAWSKGSYPNVATKWLWTPTAHWTFDFSLGSTRVRGFHQFVDQEQFTQAAREVAQAAADEAMKLHAAIDSIESAADLLKAKASLKGLRSW